MYSEHNNLFNLCFFNCFRVDLLLSSRQCRLLRDVIPVAIFFPCVFVFENANRKVLNSFNKMFDLFFNTCELGLPDRIKK